MRAAIVNPYWDTLGGGERYTITVAKVLEEAGYRVDLEWKDEKILGKLKKRFGMDLAGVKVVRDVKRGDGYDICFWVSDGSVPNLRARKNILHFQVPFTGVRGKTLFNRMKLFRVGKVVCNSKFTKSVIDKEYGVESVVVYPPVAVDEFRPKRKKEDIILYVGRFSGLTQAKRQDVLVECFGDLGRRGWKLVLAGGIEVGVDKQFIRLKREVGKAGAEIVESPDFRELRDLFGKAKIFWSASGFGADEEREPKRMEHFGITVVEAMSAGLVPVVYEAGGHKEIVKEGESGYLWREKAELISKTRELIDNRMIMIKLAARARKDSQYFGYERFRKEVLGLI